MFFQGFESAGVPPMQTRRTPHFLNGVLIGAMSTLGLALVAILGFLWICLLSRKGNLSEKYVKVDKQHVPDRGKSIISQC